MNKQDWWDRLSRVQVELSALKAELEQPDDEEAGYVGPYAEALAFSFTETFNDNLTAADLEAATKEWHAWVLANEPETKDMYDAQRVYGQTRRPTVWGRKGGLVVQDLSAAAEYFKALQDAQRDQAKANAKAARKAAGWLNPAGEDDGDYRVSPEGRTRSASGQLFGPYVKPGDEL